MNSKQESPALSDQFARREHVVRRSVALIAGTGVLLGSVLVWTAAVVAASSAATGNPFNAVLQILPTARNLVGSDHAATWVLGVSTAMMGVSLTINRSLAGQRTPNLTLEDQVSIISSDKAMSSICSTAASLTVGAATVTWLGVTVQIVSAAVIVSAVAVVATMLAANVRQHRPTAVERQLTTELDRAKLTTLLERERSLQRFGSPSHDRRQHFRPGPSAQLILRAAVSSGALALIESAIVTALAAAFATDMQGAQDWLFFFTMFGSYAVVINLWSLGAAFRRWSDPESGAESRIGRGLLDATRLMLLVVGGAGFLVSFFPTGVVVHQAAFLAAALAAIAVPTMWATGRGEPGGPKITGTGLNVWIRRYSSPLWRAVQHSAQQQIVVLREREDAAS